MIVRREVSGFVLIATLVLAIGCQVTAPSMMDRIPPPAPLPRVRPQPATPADAAGDVPSIVEERLVMRANLESVERFTRGTKVDAFIPGEEYRWVAGFRVLEPVQGDASSTLLLAIQSPLEQLAYPISGQVEFRLTFEPGMGGELRLIEIDPPAKALLRRVEEENETQK